MPGPHPQPPGSQPSDVVRDKTQQPETAPPGVAVSGFPEPPGADPGDVSRSSSRYAALNTPVGEPDGSAWPDPYDRREDPRAPVDGMAFPGDGTAHTPVGATSDSAPPAADDLGAIGTNPPVRDNVDD
jgi:hypothetical protein